MELYCISIFLDERILNKMVSSLEALGLADAFRLESLVDQTGTTANALMGMVGQTSLLFLPSNDFHCHRDFEIGLTELHSDTWETRIRSLHESGVVSESGTMPDDADTRFAIFGDKSIHGPFFGLFDGRASTLGKEDLISFQLPPREHDFYTSSIKPILETSLIQRLNVAQALGEAPTMHEIKITEIRSATNDIPRREELHCHFLKDRIRIGEVEICA